MSLLSDVLRILDQTLGLAGRSADFTSDTPLLGALPELDSMAVVALITDLEQHFGISLPDDELDGDVFLTAGSLTDFVALQVQRQT